MTPELQAVELTVVDPISLTRAGFPIPELGVELELIPRPSPDW